MTDALQPSKPEINHNFLRASIISLVAEAADMEDEEIDWHDTLVDDLGIDSLGIVAIFVDLAYDFGVSEPDRDEDWSQYDTPEKIYEYALSKRLAVG